MEWSCAIRPEPKTRPNFKTKIITSIKNAAPKVTIRPAANRHEENSLKSDSGYRITASPAAGQYIWASPRWAARLNFFFQSAPLNSRQFSDFAW
jgi:hypothetical protein